MKNTLEMPTRSETVAADQPAPIGTDTSNEVDVAG